MEVYPAVVHEFCFLSTVDKVFKTIWLFSSSLLPFCIITEILECFLKTAVLTGEFINYWLYLRRLHFRMKCPICFCEEFMLSLILRRPYTLSVIRTIHCEILIGHIYRTRITCSFISNTECCTECFPKRKHKPSDLKYRICLSIKPELNLNGCAASDFRVQILFNRIARIFFPSRPSDRHSL